MFALPEAGWLAAVKVALLLVVTVFELGFALLLLLRGPRPSRTDAVAA